MLHLLAIRRPASFDDCHEVSDLCPVSATVLGYIPNLGSSIFFAIAFGLLLIAALGLGIWKKTWTYCAAISAGVMLECLGYVGRGIMHHNVWDKTGFQIQICCIIIAPTFICAAIYLTLKHVALALNPGLSRIPPAWYPRFFLPADLTCLVVQAIGGGVAAGASRDNKTAAQTGNRTIIAGVALQVAVLLLFGVMGTDYYIRVKKYLQGPGADPAALQVWNDKKFRTFGTAVSVAYVSILIRCIYRVAEMAGGWGNDVMQDEPSFLVLDGGLVLITSTLLTVFHPGLFFSKMSSGGGPAAAFKDAEKSGGSSNEGVRAGSV